MFDNLFDKGLESLNHPGLTVSLAIATVAVVIRTTLLSEPIIVSFLNLLLSGVVAPFLVWAIWTSAPYFVFGIVAAISSLLLGRVLHKAYHFVKCRVLGTPISPTCCDPVEHSEFHPTHPNDHGEG